MSTLHTISLSPATAIIDRSLPVLSSGDAVLLIEDGTYYARDNFLPTDLPTDIKVYCLREDCIARGILEQSSNRVELVNFEGFVELSCEHDKIISWF